ncbi:hypothetical protein BGZ65_013025 [Modicella reniformis]|uniref:Peptide hydrolase n=1 Tax=Modicella reniformis TaxID=1440133 RepID=A0A9P6SNX6_9FUNG|nr:hypothetical protein BGZ65_013025 [Modicella reniformis]
MGSTKTRARNTRRKLAKFATLNPQGTSKVSELTQQNQSPTSTQEKEVAPLPSTSGTPLVAAPSLLAPPKVIMTTVELDDRKYMSKMRPKKATQSTWRNTGAANISNKRSDMDANIGSTRGKVTNGVNVVDSLTSVTDGDNKGDINLLSRNYSELAKMEGYPKAGDMVAYKLLEIDSSYNPTISDFKEATVISFSEVNMEAQVLLDPNFRKPLEMDSEGLPVLGKFDVYDEGILERTKQGIAIVPWNDLVECRVIFKEPSFTQTPMDVPGALKQRHFKGPFDSDERDLSGVSLFSPEVLVDAALRSSFVSFGTRIQGKESLGYGEGTRSNKKQPSSFSSPKTAFSAWCLFLGFLFLIIAVTFRVHYTLPSPVYEGLDVISGKPQFSEENVRQIIRYMTQDIGYRVVGTEQELDTKNYLVGDGSHRFDFMSKVVMKMYTNMTNIIVRLSCGPECDQNSILLNAHYDTTLGSPGAADDALGCGVMIEIIRIMSLRPAPKKNSVIFLFNGGEESLQDASHSFITTHELRDKVRAVVNLEACGTSGPEVLFQANSREMIDAYGTVPYPHGTVLANDLFATGLILSDTDFRQFVDHGNLTGLDMAVYKNSYLYHTHLDLDEFLEEGLPQHMGENTLALATYLTEEANLTNLERTSSVVFFDVFGLFFVSYSWTAAICSHILIAGLALFTMATRISRPTLRGSVSILLSFIAALLAPNLSVVLLQSLGSPMQWFSHEWLPVILFGPMALAAMFGVQVLFHFKNASTGANEISTLSSLQVFFTFALCISSYVGLASSYVFALFTLCITVALVFNHMKGARSHGYGLEVNHVDFATYFVASFLPTTYFSFICFSLLDMFVPLTGRIGVDAPVDNIIAIMSGFVTFVICPPLLAFSHRFGRAILKRIAIVLLILHLVLVLISSAVMYPYDELHPKRVFIQHLRNMTSGESLLYLAHADPGPFYEPYVTKIEAMFEGEASFRSAATNPSDWNAIYPFNQFLESYVLDTSTYIRTHTVNKTIAESTAPLTSLIRAAPKLMAENVVYDSKTGLRRLTVLCTHPNYIWTVASFDAHLTSWSMGSSEPFPYPSHYVIRHVGGHVSDGWRVDLEHHATGSEDRLRIELTAMETEGFGRDTERELEGSGEIGVMRQIVRSRPAWTALTYFSIVADTFEL